MIVEESTPVMASDKITCQIDNVQVHTVHAHIKKNHPDWSIERYQQEFPGAPLLSPFAEMKLEEKKKEAELKAKNADITPRNDTVRDLTSNLEDSQPMLTASLSTVKNTLAKVFDLGEAPAAKNASGQHIQIDIMTGHDADALSYLPEIDNDYVFNIDLLKKVIIGLQLNMPIYLWGMHGSGKTTVLEQASARTKRPFMRVQHTLNMQESDVLGQMTVLNKQTVFQLGPLPQAMINGWTYCADEYDTAMPNVTTLYQPVLEGKPLVIKDAPANMRKIVPHPNFRFVATGNTNGCGDETGLYQGTMMQNAANYSRFKITEEVKYMEEKQEIAIISQKAGLQKQHAKKIVQFGRKIRSNFEEQKLSMTISTRELVSAAELGMAYGGKWAVGLKLAFSNRLPRVDQQVAEEVLQRYFGE